MFKSFGGWIHEFTVTETTTHKKGYTLYKITSIIFPRALPESLTCVSVWKRFSEVKKLYSDLQKRHKSLQLSGTIPELKDHIFFKRFDPAVVQQRKEYILELLHFAAEHPALYKSTPFITFLQNDHSPETSPTHKGNIEDICDSIGLLFEREIELVDPTKDEFENNSEIPNGDEILNNDKNTNDTTIQENESFSTENVRGEGDGISQNSLCSTIFELEDNNDYIYEAAFEFSKAVQAEVNQFYEESIKRYKCGIDKLLTGSKNDTNEDRKSIAINKVAKYIVRAQQIEEKLAMNDENTHMRQPKLCIIGETTNSKTFLERPWNHLSKFKVIGLVKSVMKVQDVTEKKVYIMKGIQKPSIKTSAQSIILPQKNPYMVDLIAFFQSDTTIYLLLKLAHGGKLYDYIRRHKLQKNEHAPINENFIEANNRDNEKSDALNKKQITVECEDAVGAGTAKCSEVSYEEENSSTSDTCTKAKVSVEDNIPPFQELSEDIEVRDLVKRSEKLLKSVSNTLEHFKEINNFSEDSNFKFIDDSIPNESCRPYNKINSIKNIPEELRSIRSPQHISQNMFLLYEKNMIDEECIKRWIADLYAAINSLHSKGIILGDLRPDNILLDSEGKIILSYFYKVEGSEGQVQQTFHPKAIEGYYVAPERPLTIKSDWWSFGVILYEILTGYTFKSCHPAGVHSYYETQFPEGVEVTEIANNLLSGVLQTIPENRFDANAIKTHEFFNDIDWFDITRKFSH